jgi:hypothetical protein
LEGRSSSRSIRSTGFPISFPSIDYDNRPHYVLHTLKTSIDFQIFIGLSAILQPYTTGGENIQWNADVLKWFILALNSNVLFSFDKNRLTLKHEWKMIINLRKCADWARWKVPLPRWKSQLKRAKTASGQTEMAKFYQHLNPVKQTKNTHTSCV